MDAGHGIDYTHNSKGVGSYLWHFKYGHSTDKMKKTYPPLNHPITAKALGSYVNLSSLSVLSVTNQPLRHIETNDFISVVALTPKEDVQTSQSQAIRKLQHSKKFSHTTMSWVTL